MGCCNSKEGTESKPLAVLEPALGAGTSTGKDKSPAPAPQGVGSADTNPAQANASNKAISEPKLDVAKTEPKTQAGPLKPGQAGSGHLTMQQSIERQSMQQSIESETRNGIRLCVLKALLDKANSVRTGMKTTDMCKEFITVNEEFKQAQSSVATYLATHGKASALPGCTADDVAPATVFVSHAWSYTFEELYNTIASTCEQGDFDKQTTFFWVDVCCVNQFVFATEHTFDWLTTTFKTNVGRIGHTLLVLTPWNQPTALTRAWCLFELFCTHETNVTLTIRLPPSQLQEFEQALTNDLSTILQRLGEIDSEKAEAFKETDLKAIKQGVMRSSGGFLVLNRAVKTQIRRWLSSSGLKLIQDKLELLKGTTDPSEQKSLASKCALLGNSLGLLLQELGEYKHAQDVVMQALELRETYFGPEDPDTLTSYSSLGWCFKLQGDVIREKCEMQANRDNKDEARLAQALDLYKQAEPYYIKALKGREVVLGFKDEKTLMIVNNLGLLLQSMGRLEEAEPFYMRAFEGRKQLLGTDHADTLTSLLAVAWLHRQHGDREKALPLMREAFETRKRVIGPKHPKTLKTAYYYGACIAEKAVTPQEYAQVVQLWSEAFRGLSEVLGEHHPDTAMVERELRELLRSHFGRDNVDLDTESERALKKMNLAHAILASPKAKRAHSHTDKDSKKSIVDFSKHSEKVNAVIELDSIGMISKESDETPNIIALEPTRSDPYQFLMRIPAITHSFGLDQSELPAAMRGGYWD